MVQLWYGKVVKEELYGKVYCGAAYKVKDFLEKDEGYSVILSLMMTSFSFCINWREPENFSKNPVG